MSINVFAVLAPEYVNFKKVMILTAYLVQMCDFLGLLQSMLNGLFHPFILKFLINVGLLLNLEMGDAVFNRFVILFEKSIQEG